MSLQTPVIDSPFVEPTLWPEVSTSAADAASRSHLLGLHRHADACDANSPGPIVRASATLGEKHGASERSKPCLRALVKVAGPLAKLARFADLDDQVEACRRVFARDTRWTVVRGSDLEEGDSQGLPVWSRHVGDPILRNTTCGGHRERRPCPRGTRHRRLPDVLCARARRRNSGTVIEVGIRAAGHERRRLNINPSAPRPRAMHHQQITMRAQEVDRGGTCP